MKKILNKLNIIITTIIVFSFIFSIEVYSLIIESDKISSWIINRPIAHRGLHNNIYPENSIIAFKKAIEYDYPIELDLLLTKDNEVVVIHDLSLKRLTGDSRKVENVTYGEIKKLKLVGSSEEIPLFKDVLDEINGKVPILIEIKNCNKIYELINETNNILENYKGEYAIQSLEPSVIQWYTNNKPQVTVGILLKSIEDEKGLKCYNSIILNKYDKPDFISIKLKGIENEKIKDLRKAGYPVITWTIRSDKDKVKAKTYSDNYIFDSTGF